MLAVALAGILLTIVVVMALVIWSIRRHRDPHLKIECDVGIDSLMPTLAGLTLGTVVDGNAVEVLENGKCWDAMIERIGKREGLGALRDVPVEGGRARQAHGRRLSRSAPRAGVAGAHACWTATARRGIGKGERETMEKAGCPGGHVPRDASCTTSA